MMARRTHRFAVATVALLAVVLLSVAVAFAADVCPKCQAPVPPGAKFCTRCGARLDPSPAAAAPAPPATADDGLAAVVQVVASHDRELSSAYGEIAYGSKLQVDSILESGFLAGPGEVVTESGVVAGAHDVTLRTRDGTSVAAKVVGVDPLIGIGLLAADLPGVPVLPRRDGAPGLGESLKSIGFPSSTRTSGSPMSMGGVVSALHRDGIRFHTLEDYIQTDASRPGGFAGGPVVDSEGRLVGMSTAGVRGPIITSGAGAGISFTVPVAWIERSLAWIRAGRPPRPWLGVCAAASTPENRAQYHLPADAIWIVEEVFPDSPAAAAGLRHGDGLVRLGGEAIPSRPQWLDRILQTAPGTRVDLEVARAAARSTVGVTVAPRPEHPRLRALDALRFYGGIEVEAKSDTLVVTRVLPGSMAHQAKVAAGDVVDSLFIKKNLDRPEQYNTHWSPVHSAEDLEGRFAGAYSDFDLFAGVRIRAKTGGEHKYLKLSDLADPPGVF